MAWQSSLTAILRAFRPASAPLPSTSSPITRLRWLILPCVSWVRPASRSTHPCNATTATCAQVSPIPQWTMPPLLLLGVRYWKDNERTLIDALTQYCLYRQRRGKLSYRRGTRAGTGRGADQSYENAGQHGNREYLSQSPVRARFALGSLGYISLLSRIQYGRPGCRYR